jgi:tRNA pseudouridine38-40 synthase
MTSPLESHENEEGRRNIALLLEYDGSHFHGWQVQPVSPTIQEVIQSALATMTGEASVTLKGSGRTDAGVHALGQVANFRTSSPHPPDTFRKGLNSLLPGGIAVLAAREVPSSFDAQYAALGKVYRYRLLLRPSRSPLLSSQSWHIPHPLLRNRMSRAARDLTGERDFSSLRSSGCTARSPVRLLSRLELRRRGDIMDFELEANGFLRHMVRNIVGTLVDVGRGRIPADSMTDLLASGDRSRAGRKAPPQGLFLLSVRYPGSPFGPARK